MRQFSAALLSRALGPLIAFLSSPCGRHSAVAGRRRRSTRVRRYAPPPLPAPTPAPRLAAPREVVPAEDVALVRPYFAAHERLRTAQTRIPEPRVPQPRRPGPETDEVARGFAQVQERAAAILQQWSAAPDGDLLSGPAPRFGVVRPPEPPRPDTTGEFAELADLTRIWLDQRRRCEEIPA
ncbi:MULTISPECIES: hypothetical protein [Nocardiopsis]|uniref:Uncharacterized protein n=1 Tax=Nocardiopsis sinuspersici TaxID=501010 RepID=A0A1V3C594_9ACTN|nr:MULTISPECIES: hypothetical protein [Nocardiopsis]OOC55560.1 hypothetical protein NOSIN_18465 [Nocardiopsis sinuspersici]